MNVGYPTYITIKANIRIEKKPAVETPLFILTAKMGRIFLNNDSFCRRLITLLAIR